jgi:hypothetical protein
MYFLHIGLRFYLIYKTKPNELSKNKIIKLGQTNLSQISQLNVIEALTCSFLGCHSVFCQQHMFGSKQHRVFMFFKDYLFILVDHFLLKKLSEVYRLLKNNQVCLSTTAVKFCRAQTWVFFIAHPEFPHLPSQHFSPLPFHLFYSPHPFLLLSSPLQITKTK